MERRLADESICFLCLHAGFLPAVSPAHFGLQDIDKAEDDAGRHSVFPRGFGIDIHFVDTTLEESRNVSNTDLVHTAESFSLWAGPGEAADEIRYAKKTPRRDRPVVPRGQPEPVPGPARGENYETASRGDVPPGPGDIFSQRLLSGQATLHRPSEQLTWSGPGSWVERSFGFERAGDGIPGSRGPGSRGSREDIVPLADRRASSEIIGWSGSQRGRSFSFESAMWSRASSVREPSPSLEAPSDSELANSETTQDYVAVASNASHQRQSSTPGLVDIRQSAAAAQLKHWLMFERNVETVSTIISFPNIIIINYQSC